MAAAPEGLVDAERGLVSRRIFVEPDCKSSAIMGHQKG